MYSGTRSRMESDIISSSRRVGFCFASLSRPTGRGFEINSTWLTSRCLFKANPDTQPEVLGVEQWQPPSSSHTSPQLFVDQITSSLIQNQPTSNTASILVALTPPSSFRSTALVQCTNRRTLAFLPKPSTVSVAYRTRSRRMACEKLGQSTAP